MNHAVGPRASVDVPCHRAASAMPPSYACLGKRSRARNLTTCGATRPKKGLSILEWTGGVIPQGVLVSGVKAAWKAAWLTFMRELAPQDAEGAYVRPTYSFEGVLGSPDFPLETGRYRLYLGNPCPWCHRVGLALAARGLSDHVEVVHLLDDAERASRGGWVLRAPDPVSGARDLRGVYDSLSPRYRGRCTAPLLVDLAARRIVCNESSLIVRSLNALRLPGDSGVDLAPQHLLPEIERWNDRIQADINNGVYRCGFATTQAAYEAAEFSLHQALETVESALAASPFLCGAAATEADLRLLPTVQRFDAVYATLFRCGRRRIAHDYPAVDAWKARLLAAHVPGQALQLQDCYDQADAARSYYTQLFPLNPSGIVPVLEDPGKSLERQGAEERPAPVPITSIFQVHPQKALAA
ncbi:hypothetical protein ACKKBG_A13255 [Auxenochlorella protothecoides x Auxenochlorella symbiontica]